MYMDVDDVVAIIVDAIKYRRILRVKYECARDGAVVEKNKAPFDIGSTNPKYAETHKHSAYMFCYDHVDERSGRTKPVVHPIRIDRVISITATGATFDENELADINQKNIGHDYRTYNFAVLPERDWFK